MTATATAPAMATATTDAVRPVFGLDLPAHLAVPEAARRLTAPKELRLLETTRHKAVKALAQTALTVAGQARTPDRAPAVLVVCNTIDTARAVHTELRAAATRGPGPAVEVDLLIGRSRPVDRRSVDAAVQARYGVGAVRGDRPAILVATQTVEVGINLDVDALVTESASWDALVQRLGRLNRLGRLQERLPALPAAPAVVVHDGEDDGPVYGAARDVTWRHLRSLTTPAPSAEALADEGAGPGVDVSPAQCRELAREVPAAAYLVPAGVPILTTPILDQWARTAPEPLPDPPVDPYLHGFASASPAVTLAWRTGLLEKAEPTDLGDEPTEVAADVAGALLAAAPVRAGEEVEVPIVTVRRWIDGRPVAPVGDLDIAEDTEPAGRPERNAFLVLAWREDVTRGGRWEWVGAQQLRAGDRLVVPTERGGLDRYGWNPRSTSEVADVTEAAALDAGGLLLRLDDGLPHRLGIPAHAADLVSRLLHAVDRAAVFDPSLDDRPETADLKAAEDLPSERPPVHRSLNALLAALIEALAQEATHRTEIAAAHGWDLPDRRDRLRALLRAAQGPGGPREPVLVWTDPDAFLRGPSPASTGAPLSLLAWRPHKMTDPTRAPATAEGGTFAAAAAPQAESLERDDDDVTASSVGSGQVTLDRHHRNVRARATEIAQRLGLPADLTAAVADAAGWHDLGKVEDRFQVMLHGGDPHEAAVADQPLAKSGLNPLDRAAWHLARRRSGLPAGARHEAWSAALVAQHLRDRKEPYPYDGDLVIHLVASHHGHARPLLPLVLDSDPRAVTADIDGDGEAVCVPSASTLDLDHPGRFTQLNERYGRWGLALLESVVRCADTTVSAEGS